MKKARLTKECYGMTAGTEGYVVDWPHTHSPVREGGTYLSHEPAPSLFDYMDLDGSFEPESWCLYFRAGEWELIDD